MARWLILLGILTTLGCGTNFGQVPIKHIIMVNAEGQPVDPAGNTGCLSKGCEKEHSPLKNYKVFEEGEYRNHIEAVRTGLCGHFGGTRKTQGEKKFCNVQKDVTPPHKILIFLHGGLNLQTYSVERATKLYQAILEEGDAYPIFINWQSSLYPSYWKSLVHIRQGVDWSEGGWSTVGGYLTAPFYLASDLTRAAVRTPVALFSQIRNDIETVPAFHSVWSSDLRLAQEASLYALCNSKWKDDESRRARYQYEELLNIRKDDCEPHVSSNNQALSRLNIWNGPDSRGSLEKTEAFAKYFVTLPTKLVVAPILDAFGTSAWDVMLRSVSQLFHYDRELGKHTSLGEDHISEEDYRATGALSLFLKQLYQEICTGPSIKKQTKNEKEAKNECKNTNWEITLVGHSMGTIVMNHIIRESGDLPIKNIVYMGAASTVRDYQDTIFPYLEKKNASIRLNEAPTACNPVDGNEKALCVYHLMLHEAAESGEWWSDTIDPWPRGSLLVWLDNFLTHPLSKDDRTLGRFTNFITAVHHTPEQLKPYIHIVKFGAGDNAYGPQKHGDFGQKLKFWKPVCWYPPGNPPKDCFTKHGHF